MYSLSWENKPRYPETTKKRSQDLEENNQRLLVIMGKPSKMIACSLIAVKNYYKNEQTFKNLKHVYNIFSVNLSLLSFYFSFIFTR